MRFHELRFYHKKTYAKFVIWPKKYGQCLPIKGNMNAYKNLLLVSNYIYIYIFILKKDLISGMRAKCPGERQIQPDGILRHGKFEYNFRFSNPLRIRLGVCLVTVTQVTWVMKRFTSKKSSIYWLSLIVHITYTKMSLITGLRCAVIKMVGHVGERRAKSHR